MSFPAISGLVVTEGDKVLISDATDEQGMRFHKGANAYISLMSWGNQSVWSDDDGASWSRTVPSSLTPKGPAYSGEKQSIQLGGDEILSVQRTSVGSAGSGFTIAQRRSLDGWLTVTDENAAIDAPLVVPITGDNGQANDGLLAHHQIIHTLDGRLFMVAYGVYAGDDTPYDLYPISFGAIKSRVVGLFSDDKGHSWNTPVTIASDTMIARGIDPAVSSSDAAVCPALTQEGFNEATVIRFASGSVRCFMRSGRRFGNAAFPINRETPLYSSLSVDDCRTWTTPQQVITTDPLSVLTGAVPNAVTLGNGVVVLVASDGIGTYVTFSDNGGDTFKGMTRLSLSSASINLIRVGFNTVQLYYNDNVANSWVGHYLTISKAGDENSAHLDFVAEPSKVASGQPSRLTWWAQNMRNLTLDGGPWSGNAVSANLSASTGGLSASTAFTLQGESTFDPSLIISRTAQVDVV